MIDMENRWDSEVGFSSRFLVDQNGTSEGGQFVKLLSAYDKWVLEYIAICLSIYVAIYLI